MRISYQTVKAHHASEVSRYMQQQQGFTLIELMISLILGLLIAAAAFQVFYISQRTSTTQSSASEVQDSAVFGIQAVEYDIRLANLKAASHELNKKTGNGGIILTVDNAPTALQAASYASSYTKQGVDEGYYSTNADQLTIQFVAPQNMSDCEGANVTAGDRIVQRYFLKSTGTTEKPSYALACDAYHPNDLAFGTGTSTPDSGEVIVPNVEQFRVMLLTENGYRTINGYNALPGDGELIYGVKLGLVLAGDTPTIQAQNNTPTLFGENLAKRNGLTKVNTVRRIYEPTILLRNARYESL
ncbi:prepilin-type N-terminal cleavage/methylation domain-containing protein [Psychrobacter sp. I-STPA10]|uniref:prepilin-type N-terminal cleavage/methylation domain-containing protein n=1 Tax=Psychrobacter sp. I-STPA10 TaxID=2585769 RepID=UPI001E4F53F9|nr:prepilin-type N-terminal cleavage/methylation domain-containing protein [Psychrobacter sp. I-STPA10]